MARAGPASLFQTGALPHRSITMKKILLLAGDYVEDYEVMVARC